MEMKERIEKLEQFSKFYLESLKRIEEVLVIDGKLIKQLEDSSISKNDSEIKELYAFNQGWKAHRETIHFSLCNTRTKLKAVLRKTNATVNPSFWTNTDWKDRGRIDELTRIIDMIRRDE